MKYLFGVLVAIYAVNFWMIDAMLDAYFSYIPDWCATLVFVIIIPSAFIYWGAILFSKSLKKPAKKS